MKLGLVVVTYNSAELIGEFLDRIPASMRGVEGWRVCIVDNASADDIHQAADGHDVAPLIVRLHTNAGYAAGINAGITALQGQADCFLVLNPDVQLRPGCVRPLLDSLTQPGVGIAVPRLIDEHGKLQYSLRREPTVGRAFGEALLGGYRAGKWSALGELVVDQEAYRRATIADWATGGAMLISQECIERVGLWDESFFLYEEEVEFCLRVRDAGFLLQLAPEAVMLRFIGDEPDKPHFRALIRKNKLEHFGRRHGRLQTEFFRLALLFNELLRLPTRRRGVPDAIRALCGGTVAIPGERRQAP